MSIVIEMDPSKDSGFCRIEEREDENSKWVFG